MAKLVAIFESAQAADRAASDLAGSGFDADKVTILGGRRDSVPRENVPPSSFVGIQAQQIPGLETGTSTSPGASGLGQGEAIGGADQSDIDPAARLLELGIPEAAAERYVPLLDKDSALLIASAEEGRVAEVRRILDAAAAGDIEVF